MPCRRHKTWHPTLSQSTDTGPTYRCAILWCWLLFVFNVPSTARSFRDGTPIYCPMRRTWSSVNTPSRPGIEPGAVAWQSIMLPLRHGSSTHWCWTSHWNTQLSILMSWVRPDQEILIRPSKHTSTQINDAVMVAVSQKLVRKCILPSEFWTQDLWCANPLRFLFDYSCILHLIKGTGTKMFS